MKKHSLLILTLSLLSFGAIAQKNAYDIKIKLKGGPENDYLKLAHYFGSNQYIKVDSAKAENGVYNFKGETKLQGGIYLIVINPSKFYDMVITGEGDSFTLEADTADFIGTVKVTGSKENEILYDYRKFLAAKSDEASELNKMAAIQKDPASQELNKAKFQNLQKEVTDYMKNYVVKHEGTFAAKIIKANFEPEIPKEIPLNADGSKDSTFAYRYYKSHFWDNIDFSDDRFLRTPFLQTKLEKYFKDLVYQIKDSVNVDADIVINKSKAHPEVFRYVLWWVTNKYENSDIVGLDGVFVHLAEDYYLKEATWLDSTQRAKFQERVDILKPLRTGEVFPELIVADTLGRETSVMNSKGKYTIVYFYSPDCGHCKDAAPELVKYNDENKDKGIVIYNIAVDYELDKIKKFVSKYNTGGMLNAWDSKGRYYFKNRFDVYSTPTTYILDAEKRIIGKRIPIAEFNRFIEFHEKQKQRTNTSK